MLLNRFTISNKKFRYLKSSTFSLSDSFTSLVFHRDAILYAPRCAHADHDARSKTNAISSIPRPCSAHPPH